MSYPDIGLDLFTPPFQSQQASMAFPASGRGAVPPARPQQMPATATQPEAPVSQTRHPEAPETTGQARRPDIPEKPAPGEKGSAPDQLQAGQPEDPGVASGQQPQAETQDPAKKQPSPDASPQPEPPKKELTMDMSDHAVPAGNNLDASEEARRKAHEEAEEKRRQEWEARQKAEKEAEEEALQKLQSMSDADAVEASTKCVRIAIEHITRRNMKECVAAHVQELCRSDPGFARCVMHPKKSLANCFKYINRMARDYLKNEMEENGIGLENGGYGGDVPDETCYEWAEQYFRDPDAIEDKGKEEEFIPRPYVGLPAKKKATKAKGTAKKGKAKKPGTDDSYGQMSLEGIG